MADQPASAALTRAAARFAHTDYLSASFDLNDEGMVELYEAIVVPQWSRPFGEMLLSQLLVVPRPTGAQVLDVACGPGYPTLEIARFLGQDTDVVGIDIWAAAIDRARRKASDAWLRNVSFLLGDFLHAQLPELHFDLITCNLGYNSFADRGRALALMSRLARPGGWVLITTPLQTALRDFLDLYHAVLNDLQLTTCVDALVALVKGRPTIASARSALERTGMVVEREVSEQFTLTFADARDFFTSPVIALSFLPGWRAIVPDLALRRVVFNEVERRLNLRAAAEGRLRFDVPMLCLGAHRLVV
jgi:arsenite methyltransferase